MNNPVTSSLEVLDTDCQELEFQGHSLRLTKIVETLNWVAQDLCLALNLNADDLTKVPEEFKGLICVDKDRNCQLLLWKEPVVTVNQQGLEYLLALANKQTALQFQKWMYEEVFLSNPQSA